jgi:ABC-type branched-subunit amino acid transport system ATPase component
VPDSGRIVFAGHDITQTRPDIRSRLGLARSFQDARLFGALTVHQTICVALDHGLDVGNPTAATLHLHAARHRERRLAKRADELIALMGLASFRDKFVSELSTGSRRVVDLACQIGMEPKAILFDEPSSGIAQRETEALAPLLLRIRDETGAALLVTEHDMPLITTVADRIVALDLGQKIIEGDADTCLSDPRVVASYLGSSRDAIERSGMTQLPAASSALGASR